MPGLAVILGILLRTAPFACASHVCRVVGAAVFECDDVLQRPAITRAELASAAVTLATPLREDLGPLLSGEALALFVDEWTGHSTVLGVGVTTPFQWRRNSSSLSRGMDCDPPAVMKTLSAFSSDSTRFVS